MPKRYTAVDPVRLGRVVIAVVYAQIAAEVLMALGQVFAMTAAGQTLIDTDIRASDLPVGLTAVLYLLALAVGGFLALKWIYRVNRNAHAFARDLPISPPWAVGWNFVPIASLWKPYEAMSDAWRASESPVGWKTARTPHFLGWWWAFWLLANLLGSLTNAVSKLTDDVIANGAMMVVAMPFAVVADLLFIRVVKGLSSLQQTQINFGVFDEADDRSGAAASSGGVIVPQGA
jgi:hypothetical protein